MEVKDLTPQVVWRNFYSLTQIPRPSGKTQRVAQFIADFAQSHGAEAQIDEAGNVLIRKAATPGYEKRAITLLQAHMDMVPQKTKESNHNFETDPIEAYVDGEWVTARNTTLGADDGMGVAAAMAIIEDETVEHGPLEILITRDEETGMEGAFGLKAGVLKSNYLLNLDSEMEGEITIGCAGGEDVYADMQYQPMNVEPDGMLAYNVSVKHLHGGHSGIEIHKGYANANKLMARFLFAAVNMRIALLSSMHGGNMLNAIPRDCEAIVVVPQKDQQAFLDLVAKCLDTFNAEYRDVEGKDIEFGATPCDMPQTVVPVEIQENLINALMTCHDGVLRYIPTIPDLVETSCNLSIVDIEEGKAKVTLLARSSQDSMKQYLCNGLLACFSMAGMHVSLEGAYSGWQPNPSSRLVDIMVQIYERLFGNRPVVGACHAGLECGIIGAKYPEMDMVSFGPTQLAIHTPDERVNIQTVQKFYSFILEILKNIPEA